MPFFIRKDYNSIFSIEGEFVPTFHLGLARSFNSPEETATIFATLELIYPDSDLEIVEYTGNDYEVTRCLEYLNRFLRSLAALKNTDKERLIDMLADSKIEDIINLIKKSIN